MAQDMTAARLQQPVIRYEGTRKARHVYHFVCPCGADGELTVHINDRKPFPCPEDCGRAYVQWRDHRNVPTLTCVIEPVSVSAG